MKNPQPLPVDIMFENNTKYAFYANAYGASNIFPKLEAQTT